MSAISPTWGLNYDFLDEYFKYKFGEKLKKLPKVHYDNWYPFKSASGKWYAFHNDNYYDIRIIDMETLEPVVTQCFSNLETDPDFVPTEHVTDRSVWYAHHVNLSTYVPSYMRFMYESKYAEPHPMVRMDSTIGETEEDAYHLYGNSKTREEVFAFLDEHLEFVPVAFNAHTIWAADFEAYVDVIDLSEIDKGIVRVYDIDPIIIPIEADTVRSVVRVRHENWSRVRRQNESEEEFDARTAKLPKETFRFEYLTAKTRDRLEPGHSMRNLCVEEEIGKPSVTPLPDELPWSRYKRAYEDRKRERES